MQADDEERQLAQVSFSAECALEVGRAAVCYHAVRRELAGPSAAVGETKMRPMWK